MSLELKERSELNLKVVNTEMIYKTMRMYDITEGQTDPRKHIFTVKVEEERATKITGKEQTEK